LKQGPPEKGSALASPARVFLLVEQIALGWALAAAHLLERPKVSALLSALLEALSVQMLALLGAPVSLAVLLAALPSQIAAFQIPLSALQTSAAFAAQAQALLPADRAQGFAEGFRQEFRERFPSEHSAVPVKILLLLLPLQLRVYQGCVFLAPLPAVKPLLSQKAVELLQAPPFASKPALA